MEDTYSFWNTFSVNDEVKTNRDLCAKTPAFREKNRKRIIVKAGSKGLILESTYTMNEPTLSSVRVNEYTVRFDYSGLLTTITGVPEYCLEILGSKG